MFTKKERQWYNESRNRICEKLGITINQYNWFRRKGEGLRKIYENDCNGVYENESQEVVVRLPIERKISEQAAKLGLCTFYQTDPRGAALYLDKENIPENNYSRASCIY